VGPVVSDLVYNPYAFAVHDDPYVTYRRLRDEEPAYWNSDLEFWALSASQMYRLPSGTTPLSPPREELPWRVGVASTLAAGSSSR